MVSSMYFVVSWYRFTQDDYNDIMFIMSYMDSEVDIEPLRHWVIETVVLSSGEYNDEYLPTLTEDITWEEDYQWIEAMDNEISALEKR